MSDNFSPIVLMYHGISCPQGTMPPDRETGAEIYDLSLDQFKSQMSWLKDNGFTPTIYEDVQRLHQSKPVIITFDDGEMNNYLWALPVLKEFGWKAYFFIIAKRVGKSGYMDWPQIRELLDAGMTIGSHGLTHEILTNLLDSQMEEELRASKKNLEINLGISIDNVSIPRGFCNDKIINTAYMLGYKHVFISDKPACVKSEAFSRVAVKAHWSLTRFSMALIGRRPITEMVGDFLKGVLKVMFRESGYNWMRGILIKILK